MRNWSLQVILDKAIIGDRDIIKVSMEIIDGGAHCIQLRDKLSSDKIFYKEAKGLRDITKKNGCIFIINDRVDMAKAIDADGVHLGQDDLPYKEARRLLGDNKIIGISTHDIKQALVAQTMGADYIGIGPIFKTETKPALEAIGLDIVSAIKEKITIPAVFIGGINLSNIQKITKRGGRRVAVASAILNSEDISQTTKTFISLLNRVHPVVAR